MLAACGSDNSSRSDGGEIFGRRPAGSAGSAGGAPASSASGSSGSASSAALLSAPAGTDPATIAALRDGGRPETMSAEEALVFDFLTELEADRGVSDARYAAAVAALGEHGVLDLLGLVGYFTTISMVLNVARTPADAPAGVAPLPARAPGA